MRALTDGVSTISPEEQLEYAKQSIVINSNEKRFKAYVDESNLQARKTTDSIKNQRSIGTRAVTVNQARHVLKLPEEHHRTEIQPEIQAQHLKENQQILAELETETKESITDDRKPKRRKFVSLFLIFGGNKNLKIADNSLKWSLAQNLVGEMHAAAQFRERFHLRHVRGTEQYAHLGSNKGSLKLLLTAIEAVSTKKNHLSTQIHPQDLIHLFGELLDQLKFEIQIRGHTNKRNISTILREDKPYLEDFKYLLEWFGEKLLACMIHLSLTIDSSHNHKFNADSVERAVLHGIDRIIAMPVAIAVGGTIGPIQVEKKVSKFLDKFTDKLIQGQLDRKQLRFISIIEELYEHLIHTFESQEFQSLLPVGSVH